MYKYVVHWTLTSYIGSDFPTCSLQTHVHVSFEGHPQVIPSPHLLVLAISERRAPTLVAQPVALTRENSSKSAPC